MLFRRARWRSAAAKYARLLPRQLSRNYGKSERYTLVQINRAVADAKLPKAFIALAYAAYLTETEFSMQMQTAKQRCEYDEAAALFRQHLAHELYSASGEPQQSISDVDAYFGTRS